MFERLRTRLHRRQRGWAPWIWVGAVAVTGGGGGIAWSIADWRIEQTEDRLVCGIEKHLLGLVGAKATPGASLLAVEETQQQACRVLFDPANIERCPVFAPKAYERCLKLWRAAAQTAPAQPAASAPARVLVTRFQDAPRVAETGVPSLVVSRTRELGHQLGHEARELVRRGWESIFPNRPLMWGGEQCPTAGQAALRLTSSQEPDCLGVATDSDRFATAWHCVDKGLAVVNVWCPKPEDDENLELVGLECIQARDQGPPLREADLAFCSVKNLTADLPERCFKALVREPRWHAPEPGEEAKPLHIMGVNGQELKVCPTTSDLTWLPESGGVDEIMPVQRSHALGTYTIDKGDSGGGVFDGDGQDRSVVGISVLTSRGDQSATIVPFYRWRENFELRVD